MPGLDGEEGTVPRIRPCAKRGIQGPVSGSCTRPQVAGIGRKADIVGGLIPMPALGVERASARRRTKRGTGAAGPPLGYQKSTTRLSFICTGL
jgi:hypothetical protein